MDTPEEQKKTPWWGWTFVALCGAIPVIALGGTIPGALGGGGALFCYATSRDGKGSARRRVLLCSLVSLSCWAAFGGMALITTLAMSGPKKVVREAKPGITRTVTTYSPGKPPVTITQEPARKVSSSLASASTKTQSTKLPLPYPHEPIRTVHLDGSKENATINPTGKKALSAEEKRKIYADAASSRARITSTQLEINERRRNGQSTTVHEKQLAHLKEMYQSHLKFSIRWNKISRQELEAIIREGDSLHWAQK